MSQAGDEKSTLTYEQAIAEVERIIERIESGEAGLESTLDQYERAVKLIAHCREVLGRVEKRLSELTTNAEGRLVIEGELDEGEGGETSAEDDAEADAGGEENA